MDKATKLLLGMLFIVTPFTNFSALNFYQLYPLPYFVLAICLVYLLTILRTHITNRVTGDIAIIPEPYLPPHKRYTIGHNLISQIITDPFRAKHLYNACRREQGEIFVLRSILGERIVFITSEQALREVTITKDACFSKNRAMRAAISSLVGNKGILVAEGEDHRRLRKAVSPAMHHEVLLSLGDIFLEQGLLLADVLAERGQVDDVLRAVRLRTFAVIFETCFGRNAASDESIDHICESYLTIFLEPPVRSVARILFSKLMWFVDAKRFQYRNDIREYLQTTLYELCRQNSGRADRKTLLNLMIDANTENTLDYQEMVETVLSFLAAGQITTSLSVCWTLYLLAKYPEWQDRLLKELGKWSENDGLNGLDELPLLDRIVRESLRLYPPVFTVGKTTNQPVVVDGYQLPKGIAVRIPILGIHRSQDIWGADAEEFNPDRFLRENELARTRMFWCGFLFGPRGCIGQRFALLEIKAFVTQVLIRQRVYIKPMQDPPPRIVGPLSTPRDMRLYFKKREIM